ncbi:MAG: hypothetical protein KJO04_03040 [Bacteroidia bacterium]|nr:hypothetical protein [Bacteroidia bacterium]
MNSCYYDAFPEELESIDDNDDIIEVSYQGDIIPLWSQCVGCHKGDEPPDLRDNVSYEDLLNGYVVPGDAEASILYKSLLGIDGVSLMPPGSKWPDSKINLVKNWIDQGAKDN